MFKLFVFSAIVAIAAAGVLHDGFETRSVIVKPETIAIHEPYLTKIADRIESFPTAVSHVYRSDIHNKALVRNIVTPIVRSYAAPAIKTIAVEPSLRSPLLLSSSVLKSYEAPLLRSYEAPLLRTTFDSRPIIRSTGFVGEANFLKTHAESAPGVSLSTFESKPVW